MKFLIILFFVSVINIYSQPNVQPNPSQVGMTYEQIITMYPVYWANPDWWSGKIVYYNTAIPGRIEYYFTKNSCYAIQAMFSSEDSVEVWNAFMAYGNYVTTILHGSGNISATVGWNYPYYHKWWSSPTGNGAMMFDASNIKYNQRWRDGKLYYFCWISMFKDNALRNYPTNKPKAKLQ
jgi:hypothetical protein